MVHVWCIFGACVIFSNIFENAFLRTNCLKLPCFLFFFKNCLSQFRNWVVFTYFFSMYKLYCTAWYTVLMYGMFMMWFFLSSTFLFHIIYFHEDNETQRPTVWWHNTVQLDHTNRTCIWFKQYGKSSSSSSSSSSRCVKRLANLYFCFFNFSHNSTWTATDACSLVPGFHATCVTCRRVKAQLTNSINQ